MVKGCFDLLHSTLCYSSATRPKRLKGLKGLKRLKGLKGRKVTSGCSSVVFAEKAATTKGRRENIWFKSGRSRSKSGMAPQAPLKPTNLF